MDNAKEEKARVLDEKKQILRDLIETGKKRGKLSQKELMDVAEELEMDSDQIEKLYDASMNTASLKNVGELIGLL